MAALTLALGCGGGETTASDGDDQGEGEEGSEGGSSDEGTETGEPEPEAEPIPARGIRIHQAFVNQGIQVPVIHAGDWVDGTGRNARILKNRNAMMRALYRLDDDWVPREIEAHLILSYDDGTEEVAVKTITPEVDSVQTDLESNIYFIVPAELIRTGMKFQYELFETDQSMADTAGPARTVAPAEPQWIGVEADDMTLKAVLVPVKHELAGSTCPDAPEIDEVAIQVFHDQLYMQNPVNTVEIEVREELVYTDGLEGFFGLLVALSELHAENEDPGAYYYGLVRPCDGGPSGVGGQAIDIPGFPSTSNAFSRTAVGRWYGSLSSTANTFVHEIGHTQGRRHVACSGEEGGPDLSYPYESGDIGVWGFGVIDFSLYSPANAKDYMTYCGNTWVSDWTWEKVYPYIQEITQWTTQGGEAPDTGKLLVGLIDPQTDEQEWFVTEGTVQGRLPALDHFEIETAAGVTTLPSTIGSMGDGGAINLMVELPDTLDIANAMSVIRAQGDERTPIDSIRVGGTRLSL